MISKKDVNHIARLARIEIGEADGAKLEKELASILDFVDKLNEVDTANITPVAGGIAADKFKDLKEEARADEIREKLSLPDELIDSAPAKKGEWIEVKTVF